MKLRTLLAAVVATAAATLQAATVNVSGSIVTNTSWSADNEYVLSGYVFVTSGATLTIEPGTVIKGEVSTGAGAAALVITRGSMIMAEGTADRPIIFTSELDPLDGSLGSDRKALWGGVVVLGSASINSRSDGEAPGTPVEDQIEGFAVSSEQIPLITFGGTNDADNSGVIRYVSIRHGGATIGTGNEINGLTLGGVGSGTQISFVEVFANQDDGFEFFGGTVNASYLVAAFGGDDSFDFDQGYRGTLHHLFTIQDQDPLEPSDKAIEWDGATSPLTATPISNVTVTNLTAIGIGTSGAGDGSNAPINPRDNATVNLHNSVFVNYERGIEIESDIGDVASVISSNLWWSHVEANNTATAWGTSQGSSSDQDATSYFTTAALNNSIANPMMTGIAYTARSNGLDPRPAGTDSPIWSLPTVALTGVDATDYVGAFGNNLWISGWTNLAIAGYLPLDLGGGGDDGMITEDTVVAIVRGSASKAVNLSSRSDVTTSSPITAGFVIGGSQAQTVLIRAAGPSLSEFSVANPLANVQLQLFRAGGTEPLVTSQVVTTQAKELAVELGAFTLTEGADDATIVAVLTPGAYTAIVTGVDGATGNAIVEIYELD